MSHTSPSLSSFNFLLLDGFMVPFLEASSLFSFSSLSFFLSFFCSFVRCFFRSFFSIFSFFLSFFFFVFACVCLSVCLSVCFFFHLFNKLCTLTPKWVWEMKGEKRVPLLDPTPQETVINCMQLIFDYKKGFPCSQIHSNSSEFEWICEPVLGS